jgi:hypothetical protein
LLWQLHSHADASADARVGPGADRAGSRADAKNKNR